MRNPFGDYQLEGYPPNPKTSELVVTLYGEADSKNITMRFSTPEHARVVGTMLFDGARDLTVALERGIDFMIDRDGVDTSDDILLFEDIQNDQGDTE